MMAKYAIFPPFPGVFLCARHKRMDKYPPHHPKTSQRKNAQEDKAQCVASGEISDNPQDEGREEATQATRGPDQAGDRARLGGEVVEDEFEHGAITSPMAQPNAPCQTGVKPATGGRRGEGGCACRQHEDHQQRQKAPTM